MERTCGSENDVNHYKYKRILRAQIKSREIDIYETFGKYLFGDFYAQKMKPFIVKIYVSVTLLNVLALGLLILSLCNIINRKWAVLYMFTVIPNVFIAWLAYNRTLVQQLLKLFDVMGKNLFSNTIYLFVSLANNFLIFMFITALIINSLLFTVSLLVLFRNMEDIEYIATGLAASWFGGITCAFADAQIISSSKQSSSKSYTFAYILIANFIVIFLILYDWIDVEDLKIKVSERLTIKFGSIMGTSYITVALFYCKFLYSSIYCKDSFSVLRSKVITVRGSKFITNTFEALDEIQNEEQKELKEILKGRNNKETNISPGSELGIERLIYKLYLMRNLLNALLLQNQFNKETKMITIDNRTRIILKSINDYLHQANNIFSFAKNNNESYNSKTDSNVAVPYFIITEEEKFEFFFGRRGLLDN